jgi:uncharacterized protein YlxW (UPF0749 family)
MSADAEHAAAAPAPGEPEPAVSEPAAGAPETTGEAAGPAEPAAPAGAPGRRRSRRTVLSAVTGVLALALGLGLTIQIRASNADEPYSGASEEDLVAVLNDVEGNEERLRDQIADSREALEQLTDDRSESDSALDQAEQRAEAIGILTGRLAAEGPGVRLSISDPDEQIDASLLLEAVQELRGAGAEAIEVNGVRVIVSTAFVDTTAGIQVEGAILTEPYTVLAIGLPEDMDEALSVPGGVLRDAERAGATAGVTTLDTVTVDALVGDPAVD